MRGRIWTYEFCKGHKLSVPNTLLNYLFSVMSLNCSLLWEDFPESSSLISSWFWDEYSNHCPYFIVANCELWQPSEFCEMREIAWGPQSFNILMSSGDSIVNIATAFHWPLPKVIWDVPFKCSHWYLRKHLGFHAKSLEVKGKWYTMMDIPGKG